MGGKSINCETVYASGRGKLDGEIHTNYIFLVDNRMC